jgi:hypothetical protein
MEPPGRLGLAQCFELPGSSRFISTAFRVAKTIFLSREVCIPERGYRRDRNIALYGLSNTKAHPSHNNERT